MDYHNLDNGSKDDENIHPIQDEDVELSDVIEVIQTDPEFRVPVESENREMFNGGGEILVPQRTVTTQVSQTSKRQQAFIKIVEQPAPKALRFRYECEGRSAGSIPGTNSTPENKTYPTIQIVGYQGKAVVVVSCVTKDHPHRPHPHNLVGREGCRRGVCTLEIPVDTMTVQFSNLGIQCVKKKEIENALRTREEIRVDPFRTGFSHRNQPTSIDLNTVRLCFQVFLEGDTPGKFTVPLKPVVSEPIYDKKAMSDLSIIKLSDCVSPVDGGKKDIILLCEKVAKEDIQVRFYEENSDWEAFADFQPSQVHKQHAIWFRTPRYKTLDVSEPVKVFIQLRRPSDGATSESLPFELWPSYLLESGRRWSLRRNLAKKGNYNLFNSILAHDAKLVVKRQLGFSEAEKQLDIGWKEAISSPVTVDLEETNNNHVDTENKEADYSEIKKLKKEEAVAEEKSFNELINQVAELDEIYSETQARLLNDTLSQIEKVPESFDDNKTYSSLQLAFKNPVSSTQHEPAICNKRENEADKPPLPPKRTKKIETFIGNSMSSLNKPDLQSTSSSLRGSRLSCTGSLQRPKSHLELSPPFKQLPPTPNYSTLPNPKKRGFFSKLFGRGKNKSTSASQSREASVTPSTKSDIFSSNKSLQADGLSKSSKSLQVDNSLGRSSGNVSIHSSNSVRVPLNPPSTPVSTGHLPLGSQVVDITEDDVNMNLDLTEAEHYALYTAIAPHATQKPPLRHKQTKRQKMEDLRSFKGSDIAGGSQFSPACFTMGTTIKPEPRGSTSPYGGSVSPYGGSVSSYGGQASPLYAPNISMSPQIQQNWDSPSPVALQPTTTATQYWNITGAEMANPTAEQYDLLNIDSGEIRRLASAVDPQHSLPDLNLSFSDIMPTADQATNDMNMTDSLTKMTNMALNEFYPNQ